MQRPRDTSESVFQFQWPVVGQGVEPGLQSGRGQPAMAPPPLQQPHMFQAPPQAGYSRPNMYPSHYDGKTVWQDHKVHFEVIAELNRLDNKTKANYLAASLVDRPRVSLEIYSQGKRAAT